MKRVKISIEERFIINIYFRVEQEDFKLSYKTSANNFIQEILMYLETNDYMEQKEERENFIKLYFSENNISNTPLKIICKELYVEERTLYRIRQNNIKLIKYMIKKYQVVFISDKKCPI